MAGRGKDRQQPLYFRWIELLLTTRFPSSTKLVGLVIAKDADSTTGKGARPGVDRLVARTGLSAKTVQRGLAELVHNGLLIQVLRGGSRMKRASMYELVDPDDWEPPIFGHGDRRSNEGSSVTMTEDPSEHRSSGIGSSVIRDGSSVTSDPPSALKASADETSAVVTFRTGRSPSAREDERRVEIHDGELIEEVPQ